MRNQKGSADGILVILAFGTMLAMIFVVIGILEYTKCSSRASMMGLIFQWGPNQGCLVQVGKRWAPIEYIRIVDDHAIIQGDGE